jgi:hypothetical protein
MSLKLSLREETVDDRVTAKPPPLPSPPPLPAAASPPPVTAPPPLPPMPNVVDALPEGDAVELGGALDRCPRCQGKLISPESLGWCQKCGYCRSLEEDKARVQLARPAARQYRPPSRMEMLYWISRLPSWVWVLLFGVGCILAFVFPASRRMEDDCLERAMWCLVQLGVGLVLFFGTQFWTLLLVAEHDEKLSAKDLFLSGHLWVVAFHALPRTRWQFCLVVWAITLIVTAFWPVGGLDYMLRYLPRSSSLPG